MTSRLVAAVCRPLLWPADEASQWTISCDLDETIGGAAELAGLVLATTCAELVGRLSSISITSRRLPSLVSDVAPRPSTHVWRNTCSNSAAMSIVSNHGSKTTIVHELHFNFNKFLNIYNGFRKLQINVYVLIIIRLLALATLLIISDCFFLQRRKNNNFLWTICRSVGPYVPPSVRGSVQCIVEKRRIGSGCRLAS